MLALSRALRLRESPLSRVAVLARHLRRIIGVPDYDAYLAHMHTCHPGEEPIARDAFARDALARRYEQPGSRCC